MTILQLKRALEDELKQRRAETAVLIGSHNRAMETALSFEAGETAEIEHVLELIER